MTRVSKFSIPDVMTRCGIDRPCVYLSSCGSLCDMPRTNKGNGDAACHRMNNKDLLEYLEPLAGTK